MHHCVAVHIMTCAFLQHFFYCTEGLMENLRAGEESKINNLFYLMGWSVTVTRWEWMRRIVHCQILTEGCTQRRPPFPSHLSAPVFFLSCAQLNICTLSHFIHTHTDLHICTHTYTHTFISM